MTLGAQGLRIRATSWEQLLSGGIAFETPDEVLSKPPSEPGSVFGLYDNRRAAERAPLGPTLVYVADFEGNQRGLGDGTAVELQGVEVGEVTEAHLAYDDRKHTLVTRATFYVDPQRVKILNMPRGGERRTSARPCGSGSRHSWATACVRRLPQPASSPDSSSSVSR